MSREKVALSTFQKRVLHLTVLGLWITGTVWLINSTLSLAMKLHGAAAMVFLIVIGTLLPRHIVLGWKRGEHRGSGGFLVSVCGVLIVTGWGLYYSGNEALRNLISSLHGYLGLALPIIVWFHVWQSRTTDKKKAVSPAP
jgi:hypothetical protein